MTEAEAWMGARPSLGGRLSATRIGQLKASLDKDWVAAIKYDPDNPHHYARRFMVLALIRPREAIKELSDRESLFREADVEHVMAIHLARWDISNEYFSGAAVKAEKSFEGYRRAHFPQGVALASEVWGVALLRRGLKTKKECYLCWTCGS